MFKKIIITTVLYANILAVANAEIVARLGNSLPDTHPLTLGAKKFAELVENKSNGEIKVKVYSNGILGNDVTMTSMVQAGTLEFTTPSTATLASLDDAFTIVSLPFLYKDKTEAFASLDGVFGQNLLKILDEHQLVGLTFYDHGFRNITNSRNAINTVEDIKGLKIRVMQNKMFVDLFKNIGANPVPMPVNELFTALETRTVDAQENPFIVIDAKKFYEVQKYLSVTNHAYDTQVLIESANFMTTLTEDQQNIIREAAKESTAYQREISEKLGEEAKQKMSEYMEINEISDTEHEKFKEKVSSIIDQYREQAKSLGLSI